MDFLGVNLLILFEVFIFFGRMDTYYDIVKGL